MLKNITYSQLTVYRHFLQNNLAGILKQQNRTTTVFKRKFPVDLVKEGNVPKLTEKHRIYIVEKDEATKRHVKCVLTDDVIDVGLKGQVVDVKKNLFRNELFPAGMALYATPENILEYEIFAQKLQDDPLLTITAKSLLERLKRFYLQIPMSADNPWVLNKTHVRTAFRVLGIAIEDEFIVLPEEPVTKHEDIVVGIQYGTLQAKVRTKIYPIHKNPRLNTYSFPELWNNPTVEEKPVTRLETKS